MKTVKLFLADLILLEQRGKNICIHSTAKSTSHFVHALWMFCSKRFTPQNLKGFLFASEYEGKKQISSTCLFKYTTVFYRFSENYQAKATAEEYKERRLGKNLMTHSKPEQMKADTYIQLTVSYFVQLVETGLCGTVHPSVFLLMLVSTKAPTSHNMSGVVRHSICAVLREGSVSQRPVPPFQQHFHTKITSTCYLGHKKQDLGWICLACILFSTKNKVLDSLPPFENIYLQTHSSSFSSVETQEHNGKTELTSLVEKVNKEQESLSVIGSWVLCCSSSRHEGNNSPSEAGSFPAT